MRKAVGLLEIEFEWDHGPDLTITYFGRRTHIIGLWWSAYPVLGGAARRRPDFSIDTIRVEIQDGPQGWKR